MDKATAEKLNHKKNGRPFVPDSEKAKMRNIYLTDEVHSKIKEYGDGKFSKGIHRIITELLERGKTTAEEKGVIDMIAFDLRSMADKYTSLIKKGE